MAEAHVVAPGHPLATAEPERAFLTSVPTHDRITELNHLGWGVVAADAATAEMSVMDSPSQRATIAAIVTAALLVSLLVVGSIVGAAFTMVIQRRRRVLALLQATGADSRTVLGVVVWQGLWCGRTRSQLRTSHTASRQARRPWVAAALAAAGLVLTVQAGSKVRAGRAPEAWRESVQSVSGPSAPARSCSSRA